MALARIVANPELVGNVLVTLGQAQIGLGRNGEALKSFESAVQVSGCSGCDG